MDDQEDFTSILDSIFSQGYKPVKCHSRKIRELDYMGIQVTESNCKGIQNGNEQKCTTDQFFDIGQAENHESEEIRQCYLNKNEKLVKATNNTSAYSVVRLKDYQVFTTSLDLNADLVEEGSEQETETGDNANVNGNTEIDVDDSFSEDAILLPEICKVESLSEKDFEEIDSSSHISEQTYNMEDETNAISVENGKDYTEERADMDITLNYAEAENVDRKTVKQIADNILYSNRMNDNGTKVPTSDLSRNVDIEADLAHKPHVIDGIVDNIEQREKSVSNEFEIYLDVDYVEGKTDSCKNEEDYFTPPEFDKNAEGIERMACPDKNESDRELFEVVKNNNDAKTKFCRQPGVSAMKHKTLNRNSIDANVTDTLAKKDKMCSKSLKSINNVDDKRENKHVDGKREKKRLISKQSNGHRHGKSAKGNGSPLKKYKRIKDFESVSLLNSDKCKYNNNKAKSDQTCNVEKLLKGTDVTAYEVNNSKKNDLVENSTYCDLLHEKQDTDGLNKRFDVHETIQKENKGERILKLESSDEHCEERTNASFLQTNKDTESLNDRDLFTIKLQKQKQNLQQSQSKKKLKIHVDQEDEMSEVTGNNSDKTIKTCPVDENQDSYRQTKSLKEAKRQSKTSKSLKVKPDEKQRHYTEANTKTTTNMTSYKTVEKTVIRSEHMSNASFITKDKCERNLLKYKQSAEPEKKDMAVIHTNSDTEHVHHFKITSNSEEHEDKCSRKRKYSTDLKVKETKKERHISEPKETYNRKNVNVITDEKIRKDRLHNDFCEKEQLKTKENRNMKRKLSVCRETTCMAVTCNKSAQPIKDDGNDTFIRVENSKHCQETESVSKTTKHKGEEKCKDPPKKRKASSTELEQRASKKRVLDWLERQTVEYVSDADPVDTMSKASCGQMKFKIPKCVKETENHSCKDCKNSFKSEKYLQLHIAKDHKQNMEQDSINKTSIHGKRSLEEIKTRSFSHEERNTNESIKDLKDETKRKHRRSCQESGRSYQSKDSKLLRDTITDKTTENLENHYTVKRKEESDACVVYQIRNDENETSCSKNSDILLKGQCKKNYKSEVSRPAGDKMLRDFPCQEGTENESFECKRFEFHSGQNDVVQHKYLYKSKCTGKDSNGSFSVEKTTAEKPTEVTETSARVKTFYSDKDRRRKNIESALREKRSENEIIEQPGKTINDKDKTKREKGARKSEKVRGESEDIEQLKPNKQFKEIPNSVGSYGNVKATNGRVEISRKVVLKCELCKNAYFTEKSELVRHTYLRHSDRKDKTYSSTNTQSDRSEYKPDEHTKELNIYKGNTSGEGKYTKIDKKPGNINSRENLDQYKTVDIKEDEVDKINEDDACGEVKSTSCLSDDVSEKTVSKHKIQKHNLSKTVTPESKVEESESKESAKEIKGHKVKEKCNICNLTFFIVSIEQHLQIAHPDKINIMKTNSATNQRCEKEPDDVSNKTVPKHKIPKTSLSETESDDVSENTNPKHKVTKPMLSEEVRSESELKESELKESSKETTEYKVEEKCSFCNRTFLSANMKRHLQIVHHGKIKTIKADEAAKARHEREPSRDSNINKHKVTKPSLSGAVRSESEVEELEESPKETAEYKVKENCTFCNMTFFSASIQRHLQIAHPDKINIMKNDEAAKEQREKESDDVSENTVAKHKVTKPSLSEAVISDSELKESELKESSKETTEYKVEEKCSFCNRTFLSANMKRHLQIVHPGKIKTIKTDEAANVRREREPIRHENDIKLREKVNSAKDDEVLCERKVLLKSPEVHAKRGSTPSERLQDQWQCRQCQDIFPTKYSLKRHIKFQGHHKLLY